MKRTLLAVGVAVLVSMMLVPDVRSYGCTLCVVAGGYAFKPFVLVVDRIAWGRFILQTVFLSVLAAVLVNLLPRRPRQ